MPEEPRALRARQASNVGLGDGLDQQMSQGTAGNSNLGQSARRDPHMRSPEMVARAMLRARERAQNKENIPPEKPSSRRRSQRRGLHTSRSPLPSDYPRAPLQDITAYMQVLQRSRTRVRARMQIHGIPPLRELLVHNSPAQVIPAPVISPQEMGSPVINQIPVSEAPLQETDTTITIQGSLHEAETTVMHSAVLPEKETQTTGIRGDHPQAKRKSSLKPLMTMR